MDRKKLKEYLAPKYRAANGGEVPDDDEELDDTPEAAGVDAPTESEAPEPKSPPAETEETPEEPEAEEPAAAPSARDPEALKAYLKKQFDAANDDSEVKEARDTANRKNTILGITQGLEQMARSNGTAHGGPGVDHAMYASQMANNNAQVGYAQQDRQAAVQAFLKKEEIDQQVVKQQLASGNAEKVAQATKLAKDMNTPGSTASMARVNQWNALHKDDPSSQLDPKTSSAADVESFGKMYGTKMSDDTKRAGIKAKADTAAANRDAAAAARDAAAGGKEAAADSKANRSAEQAYTKASALADGGRGAPPSVAQALKDRTSVQKINKAFSAYPDLDKMPSAQVNNVVDEIQKLATGGQGTEAGRKGQDPGTFASAWAQFEQKVGNKPSGAELGAFLKENKQLVDGYGEQAEGILGEHRKSVYEGARGQFTSVQDERWRKTHPQDFAEPAAAAPQAAPTAAPVQAAGAKPAKPATVIQNGHTYTLNPQTGNYE